MCNSPLVAAKLLAPEGVLWQGPAMDLGSYVRSTVLVFVLALPAGESVAEAIGKACMKSDRGRGQPGLCRCIQGAADQTLSGRDQRRAARFFRDPEEAQRIRRSDARRDEAFWERYERFGETARQTCEK